MVIHKWVSNTERSNVSECSKRCQLETLKWLREKGCQIDTEVCSSAALGGHLKILKWAQASGCEFDLTVCLGNVEAGRYEEAKKLLLSQVIIEHDKNVNK